MMTVSDISAIHFRSLEAAAAEAAAAAQRIQQPRSGPAAKLPLERRLYVCRTGVSASQRDTEGLQDSAH
jgi:hypothetical protein